MIVVILLSEIMCTMIIVNIQSFYPLYVTQRFGQYISPSMVAIAMSCFEVAGVLFTPVHAYSISKMGRKNSMIIGMICLLLTNTGLGMLSYLADDQWLLFYILSCSIRFL